MIKTLNHGGPFIMVNKKVYKQGSMIKGKRNIL